MKYLFVFLCFLSMGFILTSSRSVTHHKKEKSQATIDKEVLLEDEDYDDDDDDDDDVLNLSPEEQKERLKKLVEKKIDANHDTFVDLEELQAWSLKAFDKFEIDDIKQEFPIVDTDKDGFVSWKEHEVDLYGSEYSEDTADKKLVRQYKKEKKLFEVADVNEPHGQLDSREYMTFKIPRKHNDTKKILLEDALEQFDSNKDGAISLEEYLKDENHDSEDGNINASDSEHFKENFDKDDDGLLTGDEILQWVDPNNEEEANEEADHLLSESDQNKDGKLTSDEIIENHDLWVESDATDYGKQLLMHHDEF